jgi:predicted secreted hydrolase
VSARAAALLLGLSFAVGACGGAPILANDPLVFPTPPAATAPALRPPDPIPVVLPRDDGPHDRLTEWWYYTGHLVAGESHRLGFEAVVFRAERGAAPPGWAAPLALTDERGQRFTYAQRSEIGPQVDQSPRGGGGVPTGFDLRMGGLVPMTGGADPQPGVPATPWRLAGSNGTDRIEAALAPLEAEAAGGMFGLALDLKAEKPAALHDDDGFVDFGPAGSSYYYSRTRMQATGTVNLYGTNLAVEGTAWFDHQWGDFVSVGGGGWDWFAINLGDGTDLTISIVLDAAGIAVFEYGTLVTSDGRAIRLGPGDFELTRTSQAWTSERTGRTYPAGWQISTGAYQIHLQPTVADQELDTRATTGVIYWEGSQAVAATWSGEGIGGEAYVELTRYGQ